MTTRFELDRDGLRLAGADFRGGGPTAVLLHGRAEQSGEWSEPASSLIKTLRVIALDARGHRESETRLSDVSPAAYVADVTFLIRGIAGVPVALIGRWVV